MFELFFNAQEFDYDDRDLRAEAPNQCIYRLPVVGVKDKTFWTRIERDLIDYLVRSRTVDLPFGDHDGILDVAGRTIKPDGTILELDRKTVYKRDLVRGGGRQVREQRERRTADEQRGPYPDGNEPAPFHHREHTLAVARTSGSV